MSLFSPPVADFHLFSTRIKQQGRTRFGTESGSELCVLQNTSIANPVAITKQDNFAASAPLNSRNTLIHWGDEQQSLFAKVLKIFIPSHETLSGEEKQWLTQLSGHKQLLIRGESLSEKQKKFYIQQLKSLHELAIQAQKNRVNPSDNYYGATIETMDGRLYSAINTEAAAETTHCDLRNATILALLDKVKVGKKENKSANQLTGNLAEKPSTEKDHASQQEFQEPMKVEVKTLFLVNADFHGETPIPCSDCQSWMTTPTFSPETKVVSLEKDKQIGAPLIRIRTVAQMLPLHQGRVPVRMTTMLPLGSLPVIESMSANRVQQNADQRLSENQIQALVQLAKKKYENSADFKQYPATGVSVLLEGKQGQVMKGMGSRHWSRTYSIPLDECCVAIAESKYAKQYGSFGDSKPNLQVIAYYGEEPQLPPIRSLGHLIRIVAPGTLSTLILTVENDTIHCRTASDFITEAYKAKK